MEGNSLQSERNFRYGGETPLPAAVSAARSGYAAGATPAVPPTAPVRLRGASDEGVARVDEVLPWFTHNAAIHFSAPHGLEQYGGAAWGVRDVCQGWRYDEDSDHGRPTGRVARATG